MTTTIEYKVRPITRYIVTRFTADESPAIGMSAGCSEQRGVYENGEVAYQVAYALCKAENDNAETSLADVNFVYPSIPDGVTVAPAPE